MTTDTTREAACTCGQDPHLQVCEVEVARRARSSRKLRRAIQVMEEKAAGLRRWSSFLQSVAWLAAWTIRRGAPKAMPCDADFGSGQPSRGADGPVHDAEAVWQAIREACEATVERFGPCPQIERWIFLCAFGHPDSLMAGGWSWTKIAESRYGDGYSWERIERRVMFAASVGSRHLKDHGWIA